MNNLSLYIKAHFFNSSISAVKLAERDPSDKKIKFAEALLKVKNTPSELNFNKTTVYNGYEVTKSEKYESLSDRIFNLKENNEFLAQINSGNIKKVVAPEVQSMMIHQALNERIKDVYKGGSSEVRNVRAIINSISQDVIKSKSWDEVDKFNVLSKQLHNMMDENLDIGEIFQQVNNFKN